MKRIKFKSFKRESGELTPISFKNNFPFKVKRVFIIDGNKNYTRGDHAHYKCSQFLFPIIGRMKVDLISIEGKKKLILNSKKKEGYLIKPKTWCKISFLTKTAILLVVCDMEYKFNDYIEDYEKFLKIIKKNNS